MPRRALGVAVALSLGLASAATARAQEDLAAGAATAPASGKAPAGAFRLRVAEARLEQQPGVYDRGLLYIRLEGEGSTPLGLRPTLAVDVPGVHVGPLSPGDVPGSFVARVDWVPSARALQGTLHAEGATHALGPLVFDTPPLARPGPPPDTLLVAAGLGVSFVDAQVAAKGLRGQADVLYPLRLSPSLVLAAGLELGYERFWSVDVSGVQPLRRTKVTSSGLGVGLPIMLRFGAVTAPYTPYLGVVFGAHLQNTRYALDSGDLVDKDAAVFMLAAKFGLERALGPGAIFGEVAFRNGGTDTGSIPLKGGALLLGYRLHM